MRRLAQERLVFNAERVIPSRVQVLAPMVLKPCPIPMTGEISYSRGIFRLHVGCANKERTSGILGPVPQGPG